MKLIPHRLTGSLTRGILSLSRFGTALAARSETVLYPLAFIATAAPQRISGRTS
jgi:hypothetical protein